MHTRTLSVIALFIFKVSLNVEPGVFASEHKSFTVSPVVALAGIENEISLDLVDFADFYYVRPVVSVGSVYFWDYKNSLWVHSDTHWTSLSTSAGKIKLKFMGAGESTELHFSIQDKLTGEVHETEKTVVYLNESRIKYINRLNENILSWSEPYPVLSLSEKVDKGGSPFFDIKTFDAEDYKNAVFLIGGALFLFKYIGNPFKKTEKFDY